jgi:hypothetical protein
VVKQVEISVLPACSRLDCRGRVKVVGSTLTIAVGFLAPMIQPFDIFRIEKDGGLVWVGTAETMDAAKARARAECASKAGDFWIVSLKTGNKLELKAIDLIASS